MLSTEHSQPLRHDPPRSKYQDYLNPHITSHIFLQTRSLQRTLFWSKNHNHLQKQTPIIIYHHMLHHVIKQLYPSLWSTTSYLIIIQLTINIQAPQSKPTPWLPPIIANLHKTCTKNGVHLIWIHHNVWNGKEHRI